MIQNKNARVARSSRADYTLTQRNLCRRYAAIVDDGVSRRATEATEQGISSSSSHSRILDFGVGRVSALGARRSARESPPRSFSAFGALFHFKSDVQT
jgi:hypothetical protein